MNRKQALDTIRDALKRGRNMTRPLQYGGLGPAYRLFKQALEELDALEKNLKGSDDGAR